MVKTVVKPQFLFLVLILGLFSSCGLKSNSPAVNSTSAPTFLTLMEVNCESVEPLEVYSNSREFANRVSSFITRYNLKVDSSVAKIEDISAKRANLFIESSPLKPLVLGESLLISSLLELESRFKSIIGKDNYDSLLGVEGSPFLISNLSDEEKLNFDQIVIGIRELLTKGLRWQSLQCSLEELSRRKARDVRDFFFYQHIKNNSDTDKESLSDAALKLCGQFNGPVLCLSEQSILKRKNLESQFNDHYEILGQEKADTFFKRHGEERFSCKKASDQTVLEIPYIANQALIAKLGRTYSEFEEEVSARWSNEKLKITLKQVDQVREGVLEFKWKSGGLSFVDRAKPLIVNLSEQLRGYHLMLTINHELGHVLGFPDCYHEFYDLKSKEVTYYSLDEKAQNLMCTMSPHAIIPDIYFNQLIESACSFN